jgi:hypothetical protein
MYSSTGVHILYKRLYQRPAVTQLDLSILILFADWIQANYPDSANSSFFRFMTFGRLKTISTLML